MVLPGKIAKEIRAKFTSIIHRYLAGDDSLIAEIQDNAASNLPIPQLARDSFRSDPESTEANRKRIKREELELAQLEQDVQASRIQNMQGFLSLMNQIRPDWMASDARFRLQTEDAVKNILISPGLPRAITNSAAQSPSLSISQLAHELGCKRMNHADLIKAGKLAVQRYKALHNCEPSLHRQWVDGAERDVRSYTEADRDLLTAVLTDLGFLQSNDS
jgi:hypothetical protein